MSRPEEYGSGGGLWQPSWLLWVAVIVLGLCALTSLAEPVSGLFRYVPRDYNEGWNAYWSQVVLAGGQLYPPADSAIANNYPPLFFYVVAPLGRLMGDQIFAGRLIDVLSLFAMAVNVYAWLTITRSPRIVGAFGALLLLAAFVRYSPEYSVMDDPQLLAHATMLTASTLLWRADFSRRALIGAVVLMILAGLIKHLLLALPIATTLWIAAYRRDRLASWILAGGVGIAVALTVLYLAYGPPFFQGLMSGRTYSRYLAISRSRHALVNFLPVIAMAVPALWSLAPSCPWPGLRRRTVFVLMYFLVASLIGCAAAGGASIDRNVFFDVLIAACLGAALGLQSLSLIAQKAGVQQSRRTPALVALVLAGFLAFQALLRLPADIATIRALPSNEGQALSDVRLIRELGHGAVACETLALCYWAGSPFRVDFFNYGQKLALHRLPPSSCEHVFAESDLRLIQTEPSARSAELSGSLPADCNRIIRDHFVAVRTSFDGLFLLRKSRAAGAPTRATAAFASPR